MVHGQAMNNKFSQDLSWFKLGGDTILFFIIYFVIGSRDYIKMAKIIKTLKWE
jgi:hypothetical protein